MGGKNMNPIILNQETLAEILIKCSDFIVKAPRLIFNNNVPELSAKEKFFYSETVTSQKAENYVFAGGSTYRASFLFLYFDERGACECVITFTMSESKSNQSNLYFILFNLSGLLFGHLTL